MGVEETHSWRLCTAPLPTPEPLIASLPHQVQLALWSSLRGTVAFFLIVLQGPSRGRGVLSGAFVVCQTLCLGCVLPAMPSSVLSQP